jgi:hypothetical protein
MSTPNVPPDLVEQVLNFDPLASAEEMTGESYKTCKLTEAIGVLSHFDHNQRKRELLKSIGDTYFSMTWDELKALLPNLGFQILAIEEFPGDDNHTEEMIFAWDPVRSALLTAHSYWGRKSVNTGTVYFCWKPTDRNDWALNRCSSSPLEVNGEYVGRSYGYDIREGLKHFLETADRKGTFFKKWPGKPWLWLLNFSDTRDKNYNYDAINARRISMLPKEVQELITSA